MVKDWIFGGLTGTGRMVSQVEVGDWIEKGGGGDGGS